MSGSLLPASPAMSHSLKEPPFTCDRDHTMGKKPESRGTRNCFSQLPCLCSLGTGHKVSWKQQKGNQRKGQEAKALIVFVVQPTKHVFRTAW